MQEFEVTFRRRPPKSCPVRAGRGALDRLVHDLRVAPPGHVLVVISDSNVAPLHGVALLERLRAAGIETHLRSFPAGEAHKTRGTKAALEDELHVLGLGRDGAVVALGGGVTGDLAGFVAATWYRGIPVVQVPTTVLAMADAALGGKTGIDLPGGKNLLGSFHQPWGVYADTSTLATLPDDEFRAGFAEVIKTAAVADPALFRWLEGAAPALLRRDDEAVEHAVACCLRIKGRVVARDERDTGRRAILNFGHTVAHAMEAASAYRLSHATAVAVGMVAEARLAVGICGFPAAGVDRLERLIDSFGLPVVWPEGLDLEAVLAASRSDKKARRGRVRFALPRRIGRMGSGDGVTTVVASDPLRETLAGLQRERRSRSPN
jgi:3-dehydroquinate synthase